MPTIKEMRAQWPFKKRLILLIGPWLVHFYVRFCHVTSKVQTIGLEPLEDLKKEGKGWIFTLWHQNVVHTLTLLSPYKPVSMISESFDGQFSGAVQSTFGVSMAWGSKSKGGAKALLRIVKSLKEGQPAVITPDGPRGPSFTLDASLLNLAAKSGSPLIPWAVHSHPVKIAEKSWDKQRLPRPFATVVGRAGKPFYVPPDATVEEIEQLVAQLKAEMEENERLCQLALEEKLK